MQNQNPGRGPDPFPSIPSHVWDVSHPPTCPCGHLHGVAARTRHPKAKASL